MIYEPPSSNEPLSASAPSSTSSPSSNPGQDRDEHRDRDHNIDEELETQLAELRDSFEDRAAELGRRTSRFRSAIDLKERIRERPLLAMGIGVAAGAVVGMIRPIGRLSTGLLTMIGVRVARYLVVDFAEKAFHELMNPSEDELDDDPGSDPDRTEDLQAQPG